MNFLYQEHTQKAEKIFGGVGKLELPKTLQLSDIAMLQL